MDCVLIGIFWGSGPLGLYTKAFQLLRLPKYQFTAPISKVGIPTLSRLQDDSVRFRRFYMMGIAVIVSVALPMTVFAAVDTETIILVIFGQRWREAVPIFQFLAPAACIGTLHAATQWLFVPLNRTDRQLRWTVLRTIVMIGSYCVGVQWGPMGVAAALSAMQVFLIIPELVYATVGTPIRLRDLFGALWRPVVTTATAAAVLVGFNSIRSTGAPTLANLLIHASIFFASYFVGWVLVPGGRRFLGRLIELGQSLVRAKQLWPVKLSPSANRY